MITIVMEESNFFLTFVLESIHSFLMASPNPGRYQHLSFLIICYFCQITSYHLLCWLILVMHHFEKKQTLLYKHFMSHMSFISVKIREGFLFQSKCYKVICLKPHTERLAKMNVCMVFLESRNK